MLVKGGQRRAYSSVSTASVPQLFHNNQHQLVIEWWKDKGSKAVVSRGCFLAGFALASFARLRKVRSLSFCPGAHQEERGSMPSLQGYTDIVPTICAQPSLSRGLGWSTLPFEKVARSTLVIPEVVETTRKCAECVVVPKAFIELFSERTPMLFSSIVLQSLKHLHYYEEGLKAYNQFVQVCSCYCTVWLRFH